MVDPIEVLDLSEGIGQGKIDLVHKQFEIVLQRWTRWRRL